MRRILAGLIGLFATAGAAQAQEVWGGVYAHDLSDGLAIGGFESGMQLAAGVIGRRTDFLRGAHPYVLVAANTDGGTNYAAAGLSWRVPLSQTGRVYLRPGFGLAVHDQDVDFPSPYEAGISEVERQRRFRRGEEEIDFGNRILFQPEIALGYQVSDRLALEASYLHISHATVFGDQNPGLTDLGVRAVYRFGAP
jgi:hypothetical protein